MLAILLVLIVLLNTYPVVSTRDAVFQEKRSSLTAQASAVSSALSTPDDLRYDSVSNVLRFLDLDNFDRIIVADSQGSVIYDDGAALPDLTDLQTALTGETVFQTGYTGRSFVSSIAVPIGPAEEFRGAVSLHETDTELGGLLLTFRQRLAVLSLVVGALSLILAEVFFRPLLRRLNELSDSMRIVADGDYSYRTRISGQDEISELGREFNKLTERLESNEAQRRRFVSDASHELKTPTASVLLLSDSILQAEHMDTDTVREFVSDIRTEADRLQRTTEKLLDLSRLDDRVQLVSEPVDLRQVTLDMLSSLQPLARGRDVRLDWALEDGCVILANIDDMEHVVFNLLENAVKYNVPGGSVSVHLSRDNETVTLSVADTGIGIPEEDRLNIFTRFYRVDKARSRQSGGSGLGLSIVHDAVIAHGGSIRVGNNRPKGSVFIVTFPRPSLEEIGI